REQEGDREHDRAAVEEAGSHDAAGRQRTAATLDQCCGHHFSRSRSSRSWIALTRTRTIRMTTASAAALPNRKDWNALVYRASTTVTVLLSGPPWVRTKNWSKASSEPVTESTVNSAIVGRMPGTVI